MKNILIIEDDKDLVSLIELHLRDLGCLLVSTNLGQEGLTKATHQPYDLIILDIMLPDLDGLEVCRQLRASNVSSPILMLTSKSEEIDKVVGLEMGADDYLTKPFGIRELIARVKAIMRRSERAKSRYETADSREIHYLDLHIHPNKRKVTMQDERIALTAIEFDLLVQLAANPGRCYSREELLQLVWGYGFDVYQHTVTTHINRLRTKIEPDLSNLRYILTAWGIGYRFAEAEA